MVHKYTSWGRTRSPKNIAGANGTEVSVVLVGSLTDATDGYSTENQRYLHVLVGNGSADDSTAGVRTVTMYGYNHAHGKWFALYAPPDADGGVSAAALTAPDNNGTEAIAGRMNGTFEIYGCDRVAFVGVAADIKVWAAASTF